MVSAAQTEGAAPGATEALAAQVEGTASAGADSTGAARGEGGAASGQSMADGAGDRAKAELLFRLNPNHEVRNGCSFEGVGDSRT